MRLTETQIVEKVREGAIFAPLVLKSWEPDQAVGGQQVDGVATLEAPDGKTFRAAIEIKTLATPKAVSLACQILRAAAAEGAVPILVAPFIGEKQAAMLAEAGIGWADLSGNMVLKAPGIYIERVGKPNLFPSSAAPRNVFRGTASLVSRALLLNREGFKTLSEMADFINGRNGSITIPTISKALKVLEEELLIRQERGRIRMIQPEKLLERLTQGYTAEFEQMKEREWAFTIDGNNPEWWTYLRNKGVEFVFCGFYAARQKGLAETTEIVAFVESMDRATRAFESPGDGLQWGAVRSDSEFGQLYLIEPSEPGVWFNYDKNSRMVDDLELYLEMMASSPRGPKIAEMLRPRILGRD